MRMEGLIQSIVRWNIHCFTLAEPAEAYVPMACVKCGKVMLVFDEEVKETGLGWKKSLMVVGGTA